MRLCVVCAALLIALFLSPVTAFAHALLVSSTPAAHGAVSGNGFNVELHFNVRVDGSRSRVTLSKRQDTGKTFPLAALRQAAQDTLTTSSAAIAPGEYALHWVVLSSDGHISQGEIIFTAK